VRIGPGLLIILKASKSTMSRTLSPARLKLILVALALILLSFAGAPQTASAAEVTLSTATTSSNNASTTLAKVGDVVSYRLVLSGTPEATTTPVINILGTGTTSMTASAGTAWIYSTTTTNTSVWANGVIPFYMAWGGSAGEATTTITQSSLTGANVVFDKAVPTISGITSDATASGALKVGDTITFTLATSSVERYGSVAGSYNSQTLSWALTGVSTFVATYAVTEDDPDLTTATQISGVILTDAAGNPSVSTAGTLLAKTIDANSPSTPTASPGDGASFVGNEHVVLSSTGSDSIHYTQDGTTPTCSSTAFSSFISITSGQTITALGCDTAGNDSATAAFAYTLARRSGSGGNSHRPTVVSAPAALSTPAAQNNNAPARSNSVFTRSLSVGMSGVDVQALQAWLNAHGFLVAATGPGSVGNETTMFGSLTRAAVAKFQAAHSISPAVGFFGPITRGVVSGM
jgi:chitobiase/beta-hexosaminidase-like protein/putative peptidoglycan binding protein